MSERSKELVESIIKHSEKKDAIINKLEQQNKRYKEALEFYADIDKHDTEIDTDSLGDVDDTTYRTIIILTGEIIDDRGEKARKVLEDK